MLSGASSLNPFFLILYYSIHHLCPHPTRLHSHSSCLPILTSSLHCYLFLPSSVPWILWLFIPAYGQNTNCELKHPRVTWIPWPTSFISTMRQQKVPFSTCTWRCRSNCQSFWAASQMWFLYLFLLKLIFMVNARLVGCFRFQLQRSLWSISMPFSRNNSP